MVAYSFRKTFEAQIRARTKQQTMRAGRARHARPGEQLQLYTGMRTKHCQLIGVATCAAVSPIRIDFPRERIEIEGRPLIHRRVELNDFARADGFRDFMAMRDFWRENHDITWPWGGVLIEWKDFQPAP